MSTASAQAAQQLAQQLLQAQVQFIKLRLSSPEANTHVNSLIDFCLQRGQDILIEQAVSIANVKGVIQTFAFDLNLGGGLIELIGAMSQQLFNEANQLAPTLSVLMSDKLIEQWIDKVLELDQVRLHIIQAIGQSPAIHDIIAQVTSSIIKKQLPEWRIQASSPLANSWISQTKLASRLHKTLLHQEARLLGMAEQHIAQFIQSQTSLALNLDTAELKDIALQVWHHIKLIPLNELSSGIAGIDVEEFFVLMYDSWRHLRQTDYMQQIILTGVDIFFDIYGQYPVAELLEEIGINQQHLTTEANRWLPQLIDVLNQHHILDELIRMQLAGFYSSDDTLTLIEQSISSIQ